MMTEPAVLPTDEARSSTAPQAPTDGRQVVIAPTAAERNPKRYDARRRRLMWLLGAVPPIVLLLSWQLGTSNGSVDTRFFPAPSTIGDSAWELIGDGSLQADILTTLRIVGIGFGIGAVLGIVAGLVIGTLPFAAALFRPSLTAAYTIPKLGVFPLLLLIFGIGDMPKLVLVGSTVFLLVALATADASANVPSGMADVGRAFKAGYGRKLVEIVLPSSLPGIFTSLRLSMGISLLLVVATEFVAGNEGIGHLIWNSWNLFQPAPMYVGVITSAVVGVVITSIVGIVERICTPWARGQSRGRAVI